MSFAGTAATSTPTPPGLTAAVMSQIRVLARDVWYTLQTTDMGVIGIVARTVAVQYGEPVHEVTRTIQQQVITSLRDSIGLQTVNVNVTADDVLTDDR